jgi:excinuclease ABC subunit B
MKYAIDETARRRTLQGEYNTEHGIVAQTIIRAVMNINPAAGTIDYFNVPKTPKGGGGKSEEADIGEQIQAMRLEMFAAAENLEFEKAARLRDDLKRLEGLAGKGEGGPSEGALYEPYGAKKKKSGTRPAKTPKSFSAAKRATRKWKP